MLIKKKKNKSLKEHYFIFMQIGIILALLIFLGAFRYNMGVDSKNNDDNTQEKTQEVIKTKDVVRTVQMDKPPQPPSPQPPVEVPNDQVIESKVQDMLDNIDQQISSGKKMAMPPPPSKDKEKEKIFKIVEQQPKLIGGLDSLRAMIQYPNMAEKAGIEGRVYIRFVVNKKGDVENPKIIRGPGAGLNKEALRVIKKAKFRPGIQQGHPVKVRMTMPIIFSLNNN